MTGKGVVFWKTFEDTPEFSIINQYLVTLIKNKFFINTIVALIWQASFAKI